MRRSLLIVPLVVTLMAVMVLTGCQKKRISPERYAREGGSQSSNVTQPPVTASQSESSGNVKSEDLGEESAVQQPPSQQPSAAAKPEAGGAPQLVRELVTYQVGVFSQPENAQAMRQRLESLGFRASVESQEAGAVPAHKVLATYRGTDAEARARLAQAGVNDPILIGGRVDPEDKAMPNTGSHTPVPARSGVIPASGVSYQVGAFALEANAVQLKRQLEEDGFIVTLQNTPQDPETKYRVVATWPGTDEEGRARLLEHDIFDPIIVQAGPQAVPQAAPAAEPMRQSSASQATTRQVQVPQSPDASPLAEEQYTFQVGAFGEIGNAETLSDQLRNIGFETDVELIQDQGEPRYRVVASKLGSVRDLRKELMDMGVANPILVGN